MSDDGNVIASGSHTGNDNAIHIFRRANVDSGYAYEATVTASGWTVINGDEGIGNDCSLNADGSMLVAGVLDDGFADWGSVRTYLYSGGTWTEDATKLRMFGTSTTDKFGSCVGLSADGVWLIAGAPSYNTGSAGGMIGIYQRVSGAWTSRYTVTGAASSSTGNLGIACSICREGECAIAGSNSYNSQRGIISVYHRSGTSWSIAKQMNNNGGAATELFGSAVAITPQYAIGSMHWYSGDVTEGGRIYVYRNTGSDYDYVQMLKAMPSPTANEQFGYKIVLRNGTLIVNTGAGNQNVYVYTL
jgi:hypothetical protein